MAENTDDAMGDWAAAMAEQAVTEEKPAAGEKAKGKSGSNDGLQYARMEPEDLHGEGTGPTVEDVNLDTIMDIPVNISMTVGKTKISIRNLLKLNQGSVVELDRLAGEPLDVLVNGTLIAHGEVVVVNEKYGIRLTDVISAAERIKKLK
jgi:flagellar motor switch protein FliN/FliY